MANRPESTLLEIKSVGDQAVQRIVAEYEKSKLELQNYVESLIWEENQKNSNYRKRKFPRICEEEEVDQESKKTRPLVIDDKTQIENFDPNSNASTPINARESSPAKDVIVEAAENKRATRRTTAKNKVTEPTRSTSATLDVKSAIPENKDSDNADSMNSITINQTKSADDLDPIMPPPAKPPARKRGKKLAKQESASSVESESDGFNGSLSESLDSTRKLRTRKKNTVETDEPAKYRLTRSRTVNVSVEIGSSSPKRTRKKKNDKNSTTSNADTVSETSHDELESAEDTMEAPEKKARLTRSKNITIETVQNVTVSPKRLKKKKNADKKVDVEIVSEIMSVDHPNEVQISEKMEVSIQENNQPAPNDAVEFKAKDKKDSGDSGVYANYKEECIEKNVDKNPETTLVQEQVVSTVDVDMTDDLDRTITIVAEVKEEKQPAFDETVIISKDTPRKSERLNPTDKQIMCMLNETVVISKNDNTPGVLPADEMTEVKETPPTAPKPTLNTLIKYNHKPIDSPVKNRVQQFEKMAELHKLKYNSNNAKAIVEIKKSPLKHTDDKIKEISKSLLNSNDNKDSRIKPIVIKKKPGPASKTSTTVDLKSPVMNGMVKINGQNNTNAQLQDHLRKQKENQAAVAAKRAQQLLQEQARLESIKKEELERARKIQEHEKKEKEKLAKKMYMDKKKMAEAEGRRKQAQLKLKENERLISKQSDKVSLLIPGRVLAVKNGAVNNAKTPQQIFDEMIAEDEKLDNENVSESRQKHIIENRKPQWAKKTNLQRTCYCQSMIDYRAIDHFYASKKCSPNLLDIFPSIESHKLKRTSSAHWKTPPRCSMMPGTFN